MKSNRNGFKTRYCIVVAILINIILTLVNLLLYLTTKVNMDTIASYKRKYGNNDAVDGLLLKTIKLAIYYKLYKVYKRHAYEVKEGPHDSVCYRRCLGPCLNGMA